MNRRRQRLTSIGLASALVVTSSVVGVRVALATFVDNTVQASSNFGAAPDWVAPQVGSTTIAKTSGYLAGSIKQGGTYYIYANVTDTGSPASGVAVTGETANAVAITPSGSPFALVAGSYSVEGVTYTHRSASLLATTPLSGSKSYSISSLDVAGNSRTQTGYTVSVENTAPSASDVQTTNAGGTAGRAVIGDTIVFTYSERIDPASILAGWTGASTNMVVRLIDGGCVTFLLCADDSVTLWNSANLVQLPLGSVNLSASDYHGGTFIGTRPAITFGATGTASTMVQSGSTITITLGTASATADTASNSGTMSWAPWAAAFDAAGNPASTGSASESGSNDREF